MESAEAEAASAKAQTVNLNSELEEAMARESALVARLEDAEAASAAAAERLAEALKEKGELENNLVRAPAPLTHVFTLNAKRDTKAAERAAKRV